MDRTVEYVNIEILLFEYNFWLDYRVIILQNKVLIYDQKKCYWNNRTNIMGDKLLLNFGAAVIYNFTCEIIKLLWQRFRNPGL